MGVHPAQHRRPDGRGVGRRADRADAVAGLDALRPFAPGVHPPGERAHPEVDGQDGGGPGRGVEREAGPGEGADRPAAPDGRGGVEPADAGALLEDDAAAEEPEPADDVRGDAGLPLGVAEQEREGDEQGGPGGDEGVGPQPGGVLAPLPLQPDRGPQPDGHPHVGGERADLHGANLPHGARRPRGQCTTRAGPRPGRRRICTPPGRTPAGGTPCLRTRAS